MLVTTAPYTILTPSTAISQGQATWSGSFWVIFGTQFPLRETNSNIVIYGHMSNNPHPFSFWTSAYADNEFFCVLYDSTSTKVINCTPTITPGTLYHVAWSYQSGSKILYINGVSVATATSTNPTLNSNTSIYV